MTTNQAFIKAYRQDAAEKWPTGHRGAANRRPAAAALASSADATPVSSEKVLGSIVAYVSPSVSYEVEPAVATSTRRSGPPAHARPASNFGEAFPIVEPRPTEATLAQRMDHSAKTVKRPLSAYMRGAIPSAPATIAPLQPGTTIASFHWPKVLRQLISRHGRAFDRVIDVLFAQADARRPLIGVIGHYRGVGCTTMTLCLAAQLARRERRVAAVEGHLQAPKFADCLGVETTSWLQDVLEEAAPLADAMIRAEDDRLDLLMLDPCKRAAMEDWQWATSGQTLISAAQTLRNTYDLVLVDLGTFFDPVWQPAALNLIRDMRIEAAVAVTGPDQNDQRDFETITRHLQRCGCELLGTIINRAT
jgi:Mrp family chromosome partitioning ATPase